MTEQNRQERGLTRLSFLQASAGAAAGVTAVGVPAAAIISGEKGGVVTDPSSPMPQEPIVAYVRDAQRGEVTVVSGTREVTYRDQALVRRLVDAAPQDQTANGGSLDVLAP